MRTTENTSLNPKVNLYFLSTTKHVSLYTIPAHTYLKLIPLKNKLATEKTHSPYQQHHYRQTAHKPKHKHLINIHLLTIYNRILLSLFIKNTWKPQNTKNARYTNTAPNTVFATSLPFSGSLTEPTIDSCSMLNKYPITERMTTPKIERIVQKYALPLDTTAFIDHFFVALAF